LTSALVFTYATNPPAPGCSAFHSRTCSAVIVSASEAAGPGVRDQHRPVRGEDLGRLSHEVDTGEHDDARRALGGQPREPERVTDVIGDVLISGAW